MGSVNSYLPLQLFGSGQLLSLPPRFGIGLILQQQHCAEFVGAGAAVGGSFDIQCKSVYTIGTVEFCVPSTYTERQRSFHLRIAYMNAQHTITSKLSALERAYWIVRQLSLWLGLKEARTIPNELVAQLVGVLPKTVVIAWQHYLKQPALKSGRLLPMPACK